MNKNILATIDYVTYEQGTQVLGKVYIKVISAAGGAANGNNVAVAYTQNINGIVSNKTVNIPGQSVIIYGGKISDSDPSNPFYTSFSIDNLGVPPDIEPDEPIPGDDSLVISQINIVKESLPGAGDAKLTVIAYSSYGGIVYSLHDGGDYQDSNVFTGLSAGAGVLWAMDAHGTKVSKPYIIGSPVSLLVSDPSVTLASGNVSRWSAAFNPVNFIYQRRDFEVTELGSYAILNGPTYAKITLSAEISSVTAGELVFIKAGLYDGVYEVINVLAGSRQLVLKVTYVEQPNTVGFININSQRPYYHVLTRLSYSDPITGMDNVITSINRPNAKGTVKADISSFLQSILLVRDASDYSQINFRDTNISASYRVEYAEKWDGHDEVYIELPDTYYVLYAAKQLGEQYGGNLAKYVPFKNSPATQWITDFAVPVYNNFLPFDIAFIYSEDIAGQEIYYKIKQLDINRQQLNLNDLTSYLLNEDSSFLLKQDSTRFIINRQDIFNTALAERIGLNRLLINNVFDERVYYLSLALYYNDENDNEVRITEEKLIRLDKEIKLQSFYLRWIGLTGAWNYYRFYYNQEISLDVQNAVIIKNFVQDWAAENGIEEVISKQAGQKVKLRTEDSSVDDIKGLQSIKYSPKVQMLISSNPVKWQTVVVNAATFDEYETLNKQAPFTITLNLPSINIQNQ